MSFTEQEYLRYTRHFQLKAIGTNGQAKLKNAHAVIIGCGGLGAVASLYLTAAGVGTITLVDGDCIEVSNLQRQITFSENQIGQSKALCTQQRLTQLNSTVSIHAIDQHLNADNAEKICAPADIVLDCSDNFATRYLINDICRTLKKHWLYASIFQWSGQCALFSPKPDSACLRCLYPSAPDNIADCNTAGVVGALPGILGSIQALEAIKFLTGNASTLSNQLLLIETDDFSSHRIKLAKNKQCVCSQTETPFSPQNPDYLLATEKTCITEETSMPESMPTFIAAEDFDQLIQQAHHTLVDIRSHEERQQFNVGGLHIPLDELEANWQQLDTEKPVILYCLSGRRSDNAVNWLREREINAASLQGGLQALLKYRQQK